MNLSTISSAASSYVGTLSQRALATGVSSAFSNLIAYLIGAGSLALIAFGVLVLLRARDAGRIAALIFIVLGLVGLVPAIMAALR